MIKTTRVLLCAALLTSGTATYAQQKADDDTRDAINDATVSEIQAALRAKPGVRFSRNSEGWTIANDTDGAIWSFPPEDHYAYPSAGRRRLVGNGDSGYRVRTDIRCEAAKSACDRLRDDYVLLDQRMDEHIRAHAAK
jgi:hypothetical protein